LTSRSLNPNINIISRANRSENEKKLYQAGASHVIQPFKIAGLLAAECVGQPVALEAILGILNGKKKIQLDTLIILPDSLLENQQVGELDLENKKLSLVGVISSNHLHRKHHNRFKIKNQHFYFNPEKHFVLQAEDMLVVLGRKYSIEHFQDQIKRSCFEGKN
jgi:voltage-gated potassium channel